MGLTDVIFGSPGSGSPGKYKSSGDTRRRAKKYGQDAMDDSDAMQGAKLGLGGYTAPEEDARFRRQADRTASAQKHGMRRFGQQLSRSGIGGGLAGNFMSNITSDYGKKAADQGRDLAIANSDEKQKRLQDYFNMEKSMMGYGANLSQAEDAEKRYEYEQALREAGMFGKDASGGIMGAIAERYAPGFGGDIYKQLFQSA